MYKIINNYDQIDWYKIPQLTSSLENDGPVGGIRGHKKRLVSEGKCATERHRFFSNRVVKYWNKLDESIINSPSVNCFKAR